MLRVPLGYEGEVEVEEVGVEEEGEEGMLSQSYYDGPIIPRICSFGYMNLV
jgi:hypothetical protein